VSLGLLFGAAVSTPASAHSLAQGNPYGCQINQQVCTTPGAGRTGAPPSQLPQTGGAVQGGGFSGDLALPAAGLALALAGLGVRRIARRR
jgi:hypothetical protein